MDRVIEFSGNHLGLVSAFFVVLALLLATFLRASLQGFKSVDPMGATQLINHDDAVVVDIREPKELSEGSIINSTHIPLAKFDGSVKQLEKHKDKPVIVVCRSGSRSQVACATLTKNGFDRVYNLKGGILAWQGAGLPLKRSKK
ncbi:MAG: rhodanese-like domain-containing protein [Gammaproteobacteria bacterium]|nr:rhodanese-like domain-containing protein [Gammaproteobacteria bacterium]